MRYMSKIRQQIIKNHKNDEYTLSINSRVPHSYLIDFRSYINLYLVEFHQ